MSVVIIFSGSNDRAVISFCRYAKSRGIQIVIVANGAEDYIYRTQYNQWVIAQREKNNLDLGLVLQYSEMAKLKYDVDRIFILPSTEYLNRFLLLHKGKLEDHQIYFGLCDEKIYELVSDKYSFGGICQRYNLEVPKQYHEEPYKLPYVIKPKQYKDFQKQVNHKPVLIFDRTQEKNQLDCIENEAYYIQEYVGGKSYYLLFYIFKNKTYTMYSQENLIQQSGGESMILCKSDMIHRLDFAKQYAQMLVDISFSGLIMIEIKHYNNQFYMIEANPRLWGPSQLILDAGMNIWDAFSYENGLISNMPASTYKQDTYYFWSGGIAGSKERDLQYYNYSSVELEQNLSQLEDIEIYNKVDTLEIYKYENNEQRVS